MILFFLPTLIQGNLIRPVNYLVILLISILFSFTDSLSFLARFAPLAIWTSQIFIKELSDNWNAGWYRSVF